MLCSSPSFPITCNILTNSGRTSFVAIGSWIKIQICTPDGIQLLPAVASAGRGLTWMLLNGEWWEAKEKSGIIARKNLQDVGHIRFH